jgi:hypothetical protein
MENTNEIDKQLKRKADAYIKEKAEQMYAIHEEVAEFLGVEGIIRIDYITHYLEYRQADGEDKKSYKHNLRPFDMKNKFQIEFSINYKDKLVAKFTKDLLSKMEMF